MAAAPVFFVTPKTPVVQILPADALALKTLHTPTNPTKVTAVMATSSDTASRDVTLYVTKGGVDYPLGTVNIPITAGTITATPAVNLLDPAKIPGLPIDSDGQRYLLLEAGAVLKAAVLVAVTAAKAINLVAVAAET